MDSQLDMQPVEDKIQEQEDGKKKKRRRKQNIISIIILVVGIILAFALFGNSKKADKSSEAEIKEEVPVTVKTIVLDGDNQSMAKLTKTGVLRSTESADAVTEYAGRIKNIDFNVGDQVERNQILAVFDQSNLNNSAKVSYESAQNSYALAQNNLSSTKEINDESIKLAKGAVDIAEVRYDQAKDDGDKDEKKIAKEELSMAKDEEDRVKASAENQINSAEIQLEQTDLQLQQTKIQYDKSFVKAPISGVVISKKVNNEDYLNAGQTIAQISGKGNLESKLYLSSDEVERISVGDAVGIEINGQEHDGRIESFSPIANDANRRFEVIIEILEDLSDQANKTANFILNLRLDSQNQESFFIPLESVNIGQQKKEVFVVRDEKAVAVEVETGKIIGQDIEIVKGLKVGNSVVVENNRGLRDEQKVEVIN